MADRRLPGQGRAQRTVQRILDAALAVYVRDGVIETTTNSIAAEAEMSVGTLYQYFANKEAVAAAVADRAYAELEAAYDALLIDDDRSDEQVVLEATTAFLEYFETNPGLVALAVEGGPALHADIADLFSVTVRPIADLVVARRPDVERTEAEQVARIVTGASFGVLLSESRHPTLEPDTLIVELSYLSLGYVDSRLSR